MASKHTQAAPGENGPGPAGQPRQAKGGQASAKLLELQLCLHMVKREKPPGANLA